MRKILYIAGEMTGLIGKHRLYIIAPVLITLAVLSLLVYYVGPTVVITFIYAGV
jgi:hypothetical protein